MDHHFHGPAVLRSGRQTACTCISVSSTRDGTNVFAPNAIGTLRQTLRVQLAGCCRPCLSTWPSLCPNVNSYRRFSPSFLRALCADLGVLIKPTVACPVPGGDPESMGVSSIAVLARMPNPIFLMAALLSAIHYGISNKIEPRKMDRKAMPTISTRRVPGLQPA